MVVGGLLFAILLAFILRHYTIKVSRVRGKGEEFEFTLHLHSRSLTSPFIKPTHKTQTPTTQYMRRLAEEEEDISEREQMEEEAAAAAAAAAAGGGGDVEAGMGGGLVDEEALLRLPLRAGAAPPSYGGDSSKQGSINPLVSPSGLPFLKWTSSSGSNGSNGKANNEGIGMSPIPSPASSGGDVLSQQQPPPRLPSPGPNGNGHDSVGARLV